MKRPFFTHNSLMVRGCRDPHTQERMASATISIDKYHIIDTQCSKPPTAVTNREKLAYYVYQDPEMNVEAVNSSPIAVVQLNWTTATPSWPVNPFLL